MAGKKTIVADLSKIPGLPDEEAALRLVKMYFDDIARTSLKRKVTLDAAINAYFYTLKRLRNKEKELKAIQRVVEEEERKMKVETKGQLIPEPSKEK